MKHYNEEIWVLMTRILSKEAEPEEKERFQEWLDQNPEDEQAFLQIKEAWEQEPHEDGHTPKNLFDDEEGLRLLRSKIEKAKGNKVSEINELSLPVDRGRERNFGWKIAASLILLVGVVTYFAVGSFWSPPMTHYETSNLEQRIINLPDGSVVRLNRNSGISFRKNFAGSVRKIHLTGEAFFQVKHKPDKPFVIYSGDAVIKDIGTSFNVDEKNGKVVVAVKEGIVAVEKQETKGKQVILHKNQIAEVHKDHISTVRNGSVHNYLSWMSGKMVFKEMPLKQVFRQLDHIYGIHSQLADSSIASLKLTAYIRYSSLNNVLHMIALSLDIQYRKQGKKIIWMRKAAAGNSSRR